MSVPKVSCTKNYQLFERSADNRILNEPKHKRLRKSLEMYGFIPGYPIVCIRNGDKHLVVRDGQHRLAFAQTLGLPVYYIVIENDFDISRVNNTQVIWTPRNHAETFAAQGKKEYQAGLEFADQYRLPVATAFALLAGTSGFTNAAPAFYDGTFRAKDRPWAEAVASIYSHLIFLASRIRNARLLEACMAVCRVKEFDCQRLFQNAERCRDKLVSYSTREAYLEMLEVVYNYGRKSLVALKIAALTAMKERNPGVKVKDKKAASDASK